MKPLQILAAFSVEIESLLYNLYKRARRAKRILKKKKKLEGGDRNS